MRKGKEKWKEGGKGEWEKGEEESQKLAPGFAVACLLSILLVTFSILPPPNFFLLLRTVVWW